MNSNLQSTFNKICKNILAKRDVIESEYGNTLEFILDQDIIDKLSKCYDVDINDLGFDVINKRVLNFAFNEDECMLISLADQIYTMLPKTEWRYQLKKLAEAENLKFVY